MVFTVDKTSDCAEGSGGGGGGAGGSVIGPVLPAVLLFNPLFCLVCKLRRNKH